MSLLAVAFFISLIGLIFHNWFLLSPLSSGDWLFYFPETLRDFPILPAWDTLNNGLGQSTIPFLWLEGYFLTTAKFAAAISIPWTLIERVFWFWPFLIASILSSFFLSRHFFSGIPIYFSLLAAFLYTVNTYSLMIADGGQMGVGLAYSIAPLVLARLIKIVQNSKFPSAQAQGEGKIQNSILASLVLALQIMFDPRIAYITMMAAGLYVLLFTLFNKKNPYSTISSFVIPLTISLLLNAYWFLPIIVFRQSPLPQGFVSLEEFQFFSFANFSHAFSLLHPNWPENIFGKTYFLQPEFLILPILAYSSLLFISNIKYKISKIQIKNQKVEDLSLISQYPNILISFFVILGLLGAFLAKGVNPPFGEVNQWLFQYVPGMQMFRDPTKFYLLIALSFSILIPFSISSVYSWLNAKFKMQNFLPNLFLLFTFLFLLFLIRPALMGELTGTFKSHEVPKEYVELKAFLHNQPEFFRTLWIPQRQRFGYFSSRHPAVAVNEVSEEVLLNSESTGLLQNRGVKYIIVPYDSEEELFLTDRRYDERLRKNIEEHLDQIAWLRKIDLFGNILVYEVANPKDRFWILGKGQILSWDMIRLSTYRVSFQGNPGARLIFSDRFDSFWEARVERETIRAENIGEMNGFAIANSSTHTAIITYAPQTFVYYGLFISVATLLVSMAFLLRKHRLL